MSAVGATFAWFPILMVLLLGGGGGLPLGVPPMPEDPLLSRVAPQECLVYATWSGMATPDAKASNQTEQLLAEPEIQRLLAEIERVFVAKAGENAPPPQAEMIHDAIRWGKKLLTRPVAIFVSSIGIAPTGPDIHGGLVVNLGKDAADCKAALVKYQTATIHDEERVEIGGVTCYRFKLGPVPTQITWGVKGRYLLAGIGDGSFEAILERSHAAPPAWLAAVRKQLSVERPSTLTYVNLKKIIGQLAALTSSQDKTAIEALGLGNVTSLAAVSGLDGDGLVSRMLLGIEGEPAGAMTILGGSPLTPDDLAPIPRDANLAAAFRLDAGRAMDTILAVAARIQPHASDEIERNLRNLNDRLGVDLRKDVVASLGDVWCLYNSSDEGGLILSGLTAVVPVKDHERLSAAHAKLLALAKAALEQSDQPQATGPKPPKTPQEAERDEAARRPSDRFARPRPRIEQFHFADQDVYFLSAGDLPFAPAWCLTPKELIVAAFPQQIKAYLSRGADFKSLVTAPDVADMFRSEGPVGLWYFDARKVLDYLYPMVCMGVQMASREFAREGIDLNVSVIPSAPTIYRHLRPSTSMLRRVEGGIEITSRGTVPGSSLSSGVPALAGLVLPAVQSARQAARRAQSANNLKQIALAMLNAETANGHYPPAYTADKTSGKPLLSWRVAILPYLEETTLYQQFHLDEPWDSPNNKPLLAKMPHVYRSPASRAAEGITNYLTVRGKDTAFPGSEGVPIAQITDGTSNTIMVVEASDAKAVPWTKPDDLDYDEQQPMAGLAGLWPGGFQAAFCDGSVRFLSASIDPEILRMLFNRHDGKALDVGKF